MLLLPALLVVPGCGPKKVAKPADPLFDEGGAIGKGELLQAAGATCYKRQVALEKDQGKGQARRVDIAVRGQPDAAGGKPLVAGEVLTDEALAKALVAGRVRSAFVVGIAGTGKSAFARHLDSRACEQLPVVTVSAQADIGDNPDARKAPNALLAAAMRRLGKTLPWSVKLPARLQRGMAGKPWLLVVDGAEELAAHDQRRVQEDAKAALRDIPLLRVLVLTRPPLSGKALVASGIHGVLELLPQTTEQVDEALVALAKKRPALAKLQTTLKAKGLLATCTYGSAPHYRHLMTFRDLAMITELFTADGQPLDRFDGSRVSLFAAWSALPESKDRPVNGSVRDYEAAKKIDEKLAAMPEAQRCAKVVEQQRVFASDDLVSFLPGMPEAGRCLVAIGRHMCRHRYRPMDLELALARGLPEGQARAARIEAAKKALNVHDPVDACVAQALQKAR